MPVDGVPACSRSPSRSRRCRPFSSSSSSAIFRSDVRLFLDISASRRRTRRRSRRGFRRSARSSTARRRSSCCATAATGRGCGALLLPAWPVDPPASHPPASLPQVRLRGRRVRQAPRPRAPRVRAVAHAAARRRVDPRVLHVRRGRARLPPRDRRHLPPNSEAWVAAFGPFGFMLDYALSNAVFFLPALFLVVRAQEEAHEIRRSLQQLRAFTLDGAHCHSPADRAAILSLISRWWTESDVEEGDGATRSPNGCSSAAIASALRPVRARALGRARRRGRPSGSATSS